MTLETQRIVPEYSDKKTKFDNPRSSTQLLVPPYGDLCWKQWPLDMNRMSERLPCTVRLKWTIATFIPNNVKHHFMALKRVAKLNGYHSPTVGRKYKSRYSLESIHWDLSSDAVSFSYWQMKGCFFKAIFAQKSTFFSGYHFMAHYKSPCLGLKSRF